MKRFPPSASSVGIAVVALAILAAAFTTVTPRFRDKTIGTVPGAANDVAAGLPIGGSATSNTVSAATKTVTKSATGPAQSSGSGAKSAAGPSQGGGPAAGGQGSGGPVACAAGQNGGTTDTGITANKIYLASTVAESGVGQSFLGDVRYGMEAVVQRTNRAGGICGRQLDLTLVDDGWQAEQGEQDIRNFIHGNYFALAVVPSSQGLDAAVRSHDIDDAGIPVVGTDGMLKSQYKDPWVWPVAASTLSTAHIAVRKAYDAGARTFGIVYDSNYRFGVEGEAAFNAAVGKLSGATVQADVGIQAGGQDYSGFVQTFEKTCGPCDETFMLLEPDTAVAWVGSDSSKDHLIIGRLRTDGPQPLFTASFGQGCGAVCNNMWVWTGFQAIYPPFDSQKADIDYKNAIDSVSHSADKANQFLESGYVGMELLVQAMQQVGPDLTRAKLKSVLDSTNFDSGLTQPLKWQPGNHFANSSMLGFTIQYSGSFNGFQYQNTGWVADPWVDLTTSGT